MSESKNPIGTIFRRYFLDVIAALVSGGFSLFFGFEIRNVKDIPSWWFPTFFAVLGVVFSFTITAMVRLSYSRGEHEDMLEKQRQELVSIRKEIGVTLSHISLISGFDSKLQKHSNVFEILEKYANEIVSHITGGHENVSLEEYLNLLNLSLERANTCVFATSLIKPSVFLNDPEVMRYLDKQGERKKELGDKLTIKRVFLLKKAIIETDVPMIQKLIKEHIDRGLEIGFCDEDILARLGDRYCKDFVFFESGVEKWVVDAGNIEGAHTSKDVAKIQLNHNANYINNNWTTTITGIEKRTCWVHSIKDLKNHF